MHDIIIAGGGVAGCYLASLLDRDVLVLEKESKIKLKDSGIVSKKIKHFFQEEKIIKCGINRMECMGPSRSFFLNSEEDFAYILERKEFSEFLRKRAEKKAEIKYEDVTGIMREKERVIVETKTGSHECKMVVGADGANSIIRRNLGISNNILALGILSRTGKTRDENIRVYFNKKYSEDFYSWFIPMLGEYGLITEEKTKERFELFRKELSLQKGKVFSSLIPVGYTKSYSDRCILVGDACGQTKPLTGGGIIFSLTACTHASETINRAFEKNRFDADILKGYEKAWKKDFGHEIKKQLFIRKAYKKLSNKEIDKIFADYGKHIEKMKKFDYDRFTKSWKELPKHKLLGFAIRHIFK